MYVKSIVKRGTVQRIIGRPAIGGGGSPAPSFDSDAEAYIAAVESADTQALESGVRAAINTLFIDLKAASLYTTLATGAFNLLDAPRTLAGGLVPIGAATPTNTNFVSGDITRGSGWAGNGSTKRIDTGRNNNVDGQNNQSMGVWIDTQASEGIRGYIGAGSVADGSSNIQRTPSNEVRSRSRSATIALLSDAVSTGFAGISRATSGQYDRLLYTNSIETINQVSATPTTDEIKIFTRGSDAFSDARIALYWACPALDLVTLRTCLTTYRTNLLAALA